MTPLLLLAIFLGGGSGAACRYGLGRYVGERYEGEFPLGTFLINVTGCFALGLLATSLASTHGSTGLPLAILATGFLGGYTTFSTYALEGVLLYLDGSHAPAWLSILGSVAAGLLAAGGGAGIARLMWGA